MKLGTSTGLRREMQLLRDGYSPGPNERYDGWRYYIRYGKPILLSRVHAVTGEVEHILNGSEQHEG